VRYSSSRSSRKGSKSIAEGIMGGVKNSTPRPAMQRLAIYLLWSSRMECSPVPYKFCVCVCVCVCVWRIEIGRCTSAILAFALFVLRYLPLWGECRGLCYTQALAPRPKHASMVNSQDRLYTLHSSYTCHTLCHVPPTPSHRTE
jgi:hypothetical protein